VAIGAVVIGLALAGLQRLTQGHLRDMGGLLFNILTWISLIAVLAAGLFFTSDCISEEKREGTLGFLFLTDLRGYDIAAGKLLATSLRCVYGLLALFPVLGMTLLMGGVTGLAFWKVALALINALLCSLVVGLFVSSVGRDSQAVLGGTALLMLLLTLAAPLGDAALRALNIGYGAPLFALASPGYIFMTASGWGRTMYWQGLGVTQIIIWLLFGLSCLLIPRTWQEKARATSGRQSAWSYAWKYGSKKRRLRLRRRLLDRNPMVWLVCRERWQSVTIWTLAILVAGGFAFLLTRNFPRQAWMVWSYLGALYTFFLYLWAASQTGRFFVDARGSGLTELLLVSPLPEKQLVNGQWKAILRMFAVPLLLLLAVHVTATFMGQGSMGRMMSAAGGKGPPQALVFGAAALSAITTLTNLVTLCWFGMWMGMTSKSSQIASLKTLLFVQIVPAMAIYFVAMSSSALMLIPKLSMGGKAGTPTAFMFWYPFILMIVNSSLALAKDAGFFFWARNKLYGSFREQAARNLGQPLMTIPGVAAAPQAIAAPPVIQVEAAK